MKNLLLTPLVKSERQFIYSWSAAVHCDKSIAMLELWIGHIPTESSIYCSGPNWQVRSPCSAGSAVQAVLCRQCSATQCNAGVNGWWWW